jgi:hypothetical protein
MRLLVWDEMTPRNFHTHPLDVAMSLISCVVIRTVKGLLLSTLNTDYHFHHPWTFGEDRISCEILSSRKSMRTHIFWLLAGGITLVLLDDSFEIGDRAL